MAAQMRHTRSHPHGSEQAGMRLQQPHRAFDAEKVQEVDLDAERQLRLRRALSAQMAADAAQPIGYVTRGLHGRPTLAIETGFQRFLNAASRANTGLTDCRLMVLACLWNATSA